MKCPMCDKDLPLAHDVDSGRTTLFEHGKPHRCAAHARLVEAAMAWMRRYDMSPTCHPRALEDLVDLLAAERAAATAACAAHVEEHISRAVGRAWIAEEIRALSPDGWVAIPTTTARVLLDAAIDFRDHYETTKTLPATQTRQAITDLRAALARGKGE